MLWAGSDRVWGVFGEHSLDQDEHSVMMQLGEEESDGCLCLCVGSRGEEQGGEIAKQLLGRSSSGGLTAD